MYNLFPGLKQLLSYNKSNLTGDITAGLIVAILLIPQSMAYAIIAGVPISLGLFAGTFPLLMYALAGSSAYLSVGPVSIVSLLAFSGISGIVQADSSHFMELMVILTLLVGGIQLFLSLIKVGSFFNFVSYAVINGFISAAAVIIASNQISAMMGVSLSSYNDLITHAIEIIKHLPESNAYTVGIALGSIFLLLLIKKKYPAIPGAFIVIFTSIIIVDYFNLNEKGVAIVGGIPQALPAFSFHTPTLETIQLLFPVAFMITFIAFVESYAVAKQLANKDNERLDPNQELRGLGLANITSSFVGSIPVAGAISRTAVNYQSGAKTNLSLIVTALFMLFATLYLTPLFYYLPNATLAAIIIVAVANLINIKQLIYYLKNKISDAIIFLTTFIATLMIDIFLGLIIGIFLSIIIKLLKQ
ncbi:SulP family sulfate permease [Virgibacillus natechei]|uniref:SulP family sulfate permease n=1 Tax=Virgibacillus natechei TaxID=1216297 RepID=A0ABS4IIG0_9BACI|nr:SulP family inorganic anion transporter [Virgibacillus natechei]MBP1970744.1 SulP family sulfate permease [Virgibacillus natechei]UZD12017.1 SulP family inorganic anion transporter [Virgibacillus natechei]